VINENSDVASAELNAGRAAYYVADLTPHVTRDFKFYMLSTAEVFKFKFSVS
jgi:hypothetical protein